MTAQERAICTAYTGINFCPNEDFDVFHEYAEKLMGRPVQTIEMANKGFWDKLHDLSAEDFHGVVTNESKPKPLEQARTCGTCKNWQDGSCNLPRSPRFTDITSATDGCTPNKKARADWI